MTQTITGVKPISRRAVMAAGAAAAVLSRSALAQSAPDLNALIAAARAEGELTFYSAAAESVAKAIQEGFAAKYGIKTQYLRLGSSPLLQRYASEAESGRIAADLILAAGNALGFAEQGIAKGWIEPVAMKNLPAGASFPARYVNGPVAVVQIAPWGIAYNTEMLKTADLPKTWEEILAPRFKGKILLVDVASSDAYLDLWALVHEKYGEAFFTAYRAQNPRKVADGSTAGQALGAGEALIQTPAAAQQINVFRAKGAPVETFVPDLTTGVEISLILTATARAPHPNARLLFANYVLSQEGNAILNKDPANYSVFDTSRLPARYESPKAETFTRKAEIRRLLGL